MLDDLALFVHIAKAGSLNKAALQQALPPATVTRRLQKLEQQLKCRLINRSARQFKLTLEGKKLFDDCSYLVESLQERTDLFESSVNELSGKIRLLAATNLAIGPLNQVWSTFMAKYQEIELEFILDDKVDNFLATQADFAVRVGPQQSSELYQKRIGSVKTILVASQSYIDRYGIPKTPEDLDNHLFVVGSYLKNWPLQNKDDKSQFNFHPETPRAIANELSLIKKLTLEGLGISLLPVSEITPELTRGQLIQVLPAWAGMDRNIYLIWGNGKLLTRRAKLLIDHLTAYVQSMPGLQGQVPDLTSA
ncbi:LysR family transcriptional regulator [Thalassomonas actiniarum]|uniref:LysR family transcriptional regulator n=1 Tax=Thalassomonas actiniarum TaxID=485447 RepID=A0AAE9YNQ0_9GAMM|nr:LysR family transcriptional regulator [Thalassomonas actiniarum]WDD97398.1 LysR family transcriptional regulator [Thalassomonas actiniarum]